VAQEALPLEKQGGTRRKKQGKNACNPANFLFYFYNYKATGENAKGRGTNTMIDLQLVIRTFRTSTSLLVAAGIGVLAGASHALADTLTWTNGSGVWANPVNWTTNVVSGLDSNSVPSTNVICVASGYTLTNITYCLGGNGIPGGGDEARFTNDTTYTVTINGNTNLSIVTFSNRAGVVTLNAGVSTLNVTQRFRVADGGATSTVYWAGGVLSNANNQLANTEIASSGHSNQLGILIITNGTVIAERNTWLGTTASIGKLVVSGPNSIFTNGPGQMDLGAVFNFGPRSAGSQLVITNGGRVFWAGEVRDSSNSLILVSGPGSFLYCTNDPYASSTLSIGYPGFTRPSSQQTAGSMLIVSTGATVYSDGTISIGRSGSSYATGIVVGAGAKMIIRGYKPAGENPVISGNLTIGIGSAGGDSNNLTVYDGGLLDVGGPFLSVGGGNCTNSSLQMGGVGAMSTGLAVAVRNNTGAWDCRTVITNAVLTCTKFQVSGTNNSLTVLSKGTLDVTATSATETNGLSIGAVSGVITINAGTINAVGGSDSISVSVGSGGGTNALIISNGGKLLSEELTIGSSSSFNTGLVTGAGSVISNYTPGPVYANTNAISVGGSGLGDFNYFAVQSGASLFNNGSFNIGASGTNTFNTVLFGGPGAQAVIVNTGTVNIGSGSNTFGNSLTVSNASLTTDFLYVGGSGGAKTNYNNSLTFMGGTIAANFMKVQSSNNVTFTAGQLSVGGFQSEVGVNNSNVFLVGDGTSAAYYDMQTGGSGYHDFGSPGFVVTNNAYLRGSGTLVGTTRVLGTFVPGFAGTAGSVYSSNSLSFGTSMMYWDLGSGTNQDSVTVGGDLGLGNSTINVNALSGFTAATYTLFTHTNVVTGTLSVGTMPFGFSGVISNDMPNTPRILLVVTGTGGDSYAAWVSHYGLSGGNAAGTADPDHDGMSNTNEFLAGFNPTNSAAYLHITSVAKSGANINVTYLGASGDSTWSPGIAFRTNILEVSPGRNGSYSNNFVSTGASQVLSNGTGLGLSSTMTEVGGAIAGTNRYYRVRVVAP
jgi:hypothetical protein